MDAIVGTSLAVAGTLAGAGLGVTGAIRISRQERRAALNDRIRDAFGIFLGAVYPAVAELRELPDVVGIPKLDQAYNRLRGEKATFTATAVGSGRSLGTGHVVARKPLPSPSRICTSFHYLCRFARRSMPPTTTSTDSVTGARPNSNRSGNNFTNSSWPPLSFCALRSTGRRAACRQS